MEAGRADSITAEKLAVLKARGVTRISVNPQTMKDETLKLIGRQHTVAQVKEAFMLARQAGFKNINMDMILGLPGETKEDVAATIEAFEGVDRGAWSFHAGKYGGNDADRRGRGEGAFHEALLSLQAEKYGGQF